MTRQHVNEPLHGVAVYNPGILSKQELIRLFVARRNLLQQILDDLHREKKNGIPQHRLMVGARGMGKTTMLRRIAYAVEDDEKLSRNWLPLTFPEEQYNVARISDLWLNCLDALSDALERGGAHDEAVALDHIIDALPDKNEEERARKALNALLEQAKGRGKRLLLLIDNLDQIFERLAKEHWTIREMLSQEGAPLLIGATSRPLEPTYEYQGAFYDFFKISNLNKLQLDEMHGVLRTLATELNTPQVARILDEDPARIRVLYDLTGGNPRTTVLLYGVLAQGMDGDVRTDLERLLDQCTPLYKARFEELSNQAQQVVDALALHWDPATAAAVAERARLDVNSVSSHLNRLSEQGIVEKVRLYPKKKTGFQLAERFFNIWYLMRASRRMRRKLIWLSKFLKSFYSQEDLHMLAKRYLSGELGHDATTLLKHAEYGFALSDALDDRSWRKALECTASRITLKIQDEFGELLRDSAIALDELDKHTLKVKQKRDKILQAKIEWNGIDKQQFCELLLGSPIGAQISIDRLVAAAKKGNVKFIKELWQLLLGVKKELQDSFKDETIVDQIYRALETGLMESWSDVEGAESAMHVLGAPLLKTVAMGQRLKELKDKDTYDVFKEHVEQAECEHLWAWALLGDTERKMGLYVEAEKSYLKALELSPDDSVILYNLGTMLGDKLERYSDSAEVLEKAAVINPDHSQIWCNLGSSLRHLKRTDEAEKAFNRAIEIDPESWHAWAGFGDMLQALKEDYAGAEEAYRKALAANPKHIGILNNLGIVLWKMGRGAEAEKVVRETIKIDPNNSISWNHLGAVQFFWQNKPKNAEKSFEKAILLDPGNDSAWNNMAEMQSCVSRHVDAEHSYRQALKISPSNISYSLKLASTLIINGKWTEAVTTAAPVLPIEIESLVDYVEEVLSFFRSAVTSGYVKEAITFLEQIEFDDSWRPIVEALKAIQAGTTEYFLNIAPEVRNAAQEVYELLTGKDGKESTKQTII
jgi:tetratricopeptide (TPR) repeat protein